MKLPKKLIGISAIPVRAGRVATQHRSVLSQNIVDKCAMLAHADLDGEEQVFPEAKPGVAAKGSDRVARFPSAGDVYKILIEKPCTSDEGSDPRMRAPGFVTLP
jgi:hypothetical protein